MTRAQSGHVRSPEHQFAGRQTLRRHGVPLIIHHLVAFLALGGHQRHQPAVRPRLRVEYGDTAVRRPFARPQRSIGLVRGQSQCLVQQGHRTGFRFLEIRLFHLSDGFMEIRLPRILEVPSMFRTHHDITPTFIEIGTRGTSSPCQHRPHGLRLRDSLLVTAVNGRQPGSRTQPVGPVFRIVSRHGRQAVAIIFFPPRHDFMPAADDNLRISIFLVPFVHGVGDIGIHRTVVPQCPREYDEIEGVMVTFQLHELARKVYIGTPHPDARRNLTRVTLAEPRPPGRVPLVHAAAVGILARLQEQHFGMAVGAYPPERHAVYIPRVCVAAPVGVRPRDDVLDALLCHDRNQSPGNAGDVELLEHIGRHAGQPLQLARELEYMKQFFIRTNARIQVHITGIHTKVAAPDSRNDLIPFLRF